jgi:rubrerythrin
MAKRYGNAPKRSLISRIHDFVNRWSKQHENANYCNEREGGIIMFMTEVLRRCSDLEQRVADIYSQFAGSLNDDKQLESFWLGMAEEEKHHSKILAAEKAALEVDSDTGYFMPEFPAKLAEMDALLKSVEEKARLGVTKEEAFSLALHLEQSEINTIYRDLVLMGRAAVKLMARHMDQSLSLPKHQQALIEGLKRFVSSGPLLQQAETWVKENRVA